MLRGNAGILCNIEQPYVLRSHDPHAEGTAMIDEMQVKNLALIKQAALAPAQGLTVLTGETGAGKTALLSALIYSSGT